MIAWIDATRSDGALRVFGMTLLERLLWALSQVGAVLREVRVELPAGAAAPALPDDLAAALPLRWSSGDAPIGRRFEQALHSAAGEPLVALASDSVVDTRLLAHFLGTRGGLALESGTDDLRCALLRLEGPLAEPIAPDAGLAAVAEQAVRESAAKDFARSDFDAYVRKLRRELAPYLFRIPNDARRDVVERFLFWSNYKGSTDFLTKYVYPPLVWRLLRPLARRRVHPNWVTAGSYVATLASVPLFATGAWLPGIALAYAMSVLDSVDGKLARLTFSSSRLGDILDHGLDLVHPPVWYMAWAWGLGGGDPRSAPFVASLWLLGVYVLDRLCAPIFKVRTGRSIHGFTPLDERMRTFISRRNVNLAAFTLALLVDVVAPGHRVALLTFYAIIAWQVVSFVWHAVRTVQLWNARAAR